jgi:hypothetical protein
MGVHRSTYYRWKREVGRRGLEMLRPRERRRPAMPNQLSVPVEQRIVTFCLTRGRIRSPQRDRETLRAHRLIGVEQEHGHHRPRA